MKKQKGIKVSDRSEIKVNPVAVKPFHVAYKREIQKYRPVPVIPRIFVKNMPKRVTAKKRKR
ncbi:MAG: hypothetical protein L6V93_05955 [Clostridiales bacterium]|nr:MAG: hypothetical protein L6V93_05955 [Clostridiales bacterium]